VYELRELIHLKEEAKKASSFSYVSDKRVAFTPGFDNDIEKLLKSVK